MINKRLAIFVASLLFITFNASTTAHAASPAPASVPLDGIFKVPEGAHSSTDGNNVIITKNEESQKGSIYSTDKNKLDLTQDFVSEMYINLNGDADGVAFVMHNDPERTKTFSGVAGNGLTIYADGVIGNYSTRKLNGTQLKKSFAIEFDTYYNGDNFDHGLDKNEDRGHIAYTFPDKLDTYVVNGNNNEITTVNHNGTQFPSFKLGDGQWRLLKVEWTKWDKNNEGTLTYKYGDLDKVTVKIPRDTFGTDDVYWGFNGSTGGSKEEAVVAFKTVPGLVNYTDQIVFENNKSEKTDQFTRNSDVTVHYTGSYNGGKQDLIEPEYTFTLSDNQVYQEGTFYVDGVKATPTYKDNKVTVKLGKDLSKKDDKVDIQFKIKNENTTVGQVLNVGVNTKAKNAILDNEASYTIYKDPVPPKVTPKLIQVELNDTTALKNPREGIDSVEDEDTKPDDMTYAFVTSEKDRKEMIKKVGVYNVDIEVTNEDGLSTTTTAPVIVHEKGETILDGFVVGDDFSIDYTKWKKATASERRQLLIEKGAIKGYSISGNAVTDVTNDANQLKIDIPEKTWEPGESFDVPVNVNSYTKTIKVTLTPGEVHMNVKQVYTGTAGDDGTKGTPIYSDLQSKTPVDNEVISEQVTMNDSIKDIIQKHIDQKEFTLNYDGYENKDITKYSVYQNGKLVSTSPTKVPDEDFTIVYEYEGELRFQDVAQKLNFGTIEIKDGKSSTPLTSDSDSNISIINTMQKSSWKLKAKLSDGIQKEGQPEKFFLGRIVYKKGEETQEIGTSSSIIKEHTEANLLYSELSLKDKNNNGLYLEQDGGNLKGNYSGKLIWTLEDTP